MTAKRQRPFIGACHDPLELWFLEFEKDGQVYRRYFADRPEATAALAVERAKLTPAQQRIMDAIRAAAGGDGRADVTAVYEAWDKAALNMPVQFVGRAFVRCYASLKRRQLIEDGQDGKVWVKG